jgi:sirohydrochlorin ferrochelatase
VWLRRKDPVDQAGQAQAPKNGQAAPAVVIVDHGSRNTGANAVVEELARLVQSRAGAQASVSFAHMELGEPSLPAAIEACVAAGARVVIVQPLFLAPGKHAVTDIPGMVSDARRRFPDVEFQLGGVIGADPLLADILWARCGSPRVV